MTNPVRFKRLASAGDTLAVGGAGAGAKLHQIVINSSAANSTILVFESNPSAADSRVAVITPGVPGYLDYGGAICRNGLFVLLSVGNSDVTVTYE